MITPNPAVASQLSYTIARAKATPELQGLWDGQAWGQCNALAINQFHPDSISRHPKTLAKILYDDQCVYVHFRVDDQHVRSIYTNYQDNVCRDSCVEFFVQPLPDKGYFNFELNCGGTMLLYYITDHHRKPEGGFKKYQHVPYDLAKQVKIYTNMPLTTPAALPGPITWQVEMAIPLALMETYVGKLDPTPGNAWRANLYKCGGDEAYNHWVSWSPIGNLNFHQPQFFAPLVFGE